MVGVGQLSGQAATPERVSCAREELVGLACDVTLQHAHDLGLGETFFGAPLDVGAGAGVGAHAGEHDPPERMVRLTVPGAAESMPDVVCLTRRARGATPHMCAHAASLRIRSGLSPAATNKIAAVSTPTP